MIDCHCHLEQREFNNEREKLIEKWKSKLKAIVTCCSHPKDFNLTLDLIKRYPKFIFCTVGIHPHYANISEEEISNFIKKIEKNRENIVAIGETGLDWHFIKENEIEKIKEKQEELFLKLIHLAKKIDKPLVIHSRDATSKVIEILERESMVDKVLMHLFNDKKNLSKIIDNGWYISVGPGIIKSKDIKKITRDMPLNKILLETDSPWFAQPGQEFGTPLNVNIPCESIAKIKKIEISRVEEITDANAIDFFSLKL